MAVHKRRIRELALKAEATKGTFNAPATNGTESKLAIIDPVLEWNDETHERNISHTDLSKFPALVGKTLMKITGKLEMRRSLATTVEDQWFLILKACGLVLTNPASNCVFKPTSLHTLETTLSAYAYLGSTGGATVRAAIKGIAGTFSVEHAVGQPSMLSFELFGVYNGFSHAGTPNSVTHETAKPFTFLNVSFLFDSFAAKISRFGWALGAEVVPRDSVNAAEGVDYFVIVDRKPTFEFDPEWDSTKDWNALMKAGTQCAVSFNIQGATLTLAFPSAQIRTVADGDRNNLAVAQCTGDLNRGAAGDDEFVLTAA